MNLLFFRFIAERSPAEAPAIRGYLKQIGLGNQICSTCPVSSLESGAQITTLLAVAHDFTTRYQDLDLALKSSLQRNPNLDLAQAFQD